MLLNIVYVTAFIVGMTAGDGQGRLAALLVAAILAARAAVRHRLAVGALAPSPSLWNRPRRHLGGVRP